MSAFCLAKIHHRKEVNYVPILRNSIMVNWMETSNNQGARYSNSAIGWIIRKFWSTSCQWQRLFCSMLHINRLSCLAKFLCSGYWEIFTWFKVARAIQLLHTQFHRVIFHYTHGQFSLPSHFCLYPWGLLPS